MDFAEQIVSVLKEKGISKRWLAKQLELTDTSINLKLKCNRFTVAERFFIRDLIGLIEEKNVHKL